MLKNTLLACLALWGTMILAKPASDLLFSAGFDGYSMNADHAGGDKTCISFDNPSLQLRMWEGVAGKGNALTLARSEQCIYRMPGNFDPRQGTVSFWVSPLNWKPSQRCFQWFFTASQPGFTMHVYKFLWPNYLYFYIKFDRAPGSQQTFVASTRINDKDWPLNSWHRLDAVWNRLGMKLYVDGVLPPPDNTRGRAPTHPAITFPQPMDFPQAHPNGIVKLHHMTNAQKHRDHRTAYDHLRIFNRPLSGKDIHESYVKLIPSAFGSRRDRQMLSVPHGKALTMNVTDTTPHRWADASSAPLNQRALFSKNKSLPYEGKIFLKQDGKNLLLRLEGNLPPAKANHTQRDAAIWEDDSYEVHLLGGDGKTRYQFIVNANGAVYDKREDDAAWNANLTVSAGKTGDGWGVELAIPLEDLGGKPAKGNFCHTNFDSDMAAFGWNRPGSYQYAQMAQWGDLNWTDQRVQTKQLGQLDQGKLDLHMSYDRDVTLTATCEAENGTRRTFTGSLADTPWNMHLQGGHHRLKLTGTKDRKTIYAYEHFFYVNEPLEVTLDCHATQKLLNLNLDANNAGPKAREDILSKGLDGTVALLDQNGKAVRSQTFKATALMTTVALPLDQLAPGPYQVTVDLAGMQTSRKLLIPDPRPFITKAGVDHTVPPPWFPVRDLGNLTFDVLDRSYAFENGPFPRQIVSREKELFVQRPRLTLNDTPIHWTRATVTQRHPDYITLSGTGKAQGFSLNWQGKLWFDGMYAIDWQVTGTGDLRKLTLTYAIPREFARFVFRQGYNKHLFAWKNDRIEKLFNPLKHPDSTLQWMSGRVQGLAFAPRSNANWANRPGEANIIINRTDELAQLTAKIISRPVRMSAPLTYTMVFQGTPSRRPDPDWRDVNFNGYRVPTMQNLQMGGGGDHAFVDTRADSRWLTPSTHRPRFEARYRNYVRNLKPPKPTRSPLPFRPANYVMPMHLGTNEPEFQYFIRDWVTQPNCVWGYREDGIPQTIYSCCGQTGITDFALYHLERLFKTNPYVSIYNDCAHSHACENPRHGCGGVDALGQKFSTSTMLGQRDYFLREFKLVRKYGRKLANHVPAADFVPFVHDFSDLIWPGEEFHTPFIKNPDYFYCESVSKDVYQSAFSPIIRGVNVCLLPQPARAARVPSLRHRLKAFETEPEWAMRTMTPVLLHGFNISADWIDPATVDRWWVIKHQLSLRDAVFHGYWEQHDLCSSSPGVYVSYYRLPPKSGFRLLVVVGNLGRQPQPLALTISLPFSQAIDLWNGNRALTAQQLRELPLPGNHTALIGIR